MGNCHPIETSYTTADLSYRYGEHFFHLDHARASATAEAIGVIAPLIRNGMFKVIGHQIVSGGAAYDVGSMLANHVDRISRFEAGPSGALWVDIRAAALSTLDSTYILTCRSSSTGVGTPHFPLFTNDSLRWRG
jgi:hypothetical protein